MKEVEQYLDSIMDLREVDGDSIEAKIKHAIVQAYSNGFHDGQYSMYHRLPKPTNTGGDKGGLEYYETL